mmetsp:Transcript_24081/g.59846  ORF Transcript_24081/g.59846 Transcript_24081/m.59846 type:complete len:299 (+) Transcript_24081:286-1182(+)
MVLVCRLGRRAAFNKAEKRRPGDRVIHAERRNRVLELLVLLELLHGIRSPRAEEPCAETNVGLVHDPLGDQHVLKVQDAFSGIALAEGCLGNRLTVVRRVGLPAMLHFAEVVLLVVGLVFEASAAKIIVVALHALVSGTSNRNRVARVAAHTDVPVKLGAATRAPAAPSMTSTAPAASAASATGPHTGAPEGMATHAAKDLLNKVLRGRRRTMRRRRWWEETLSARRRLRRESLGARRRRRETESAWGRGPRKWRRARPRLSKRRPPGAERTARVFLAPPLLHPAAHLQQHILHLALP